MNFRYWACFPGSSRLWRRHDANMPGRILKVGSMSAVGRRISQTGERRRVAVGILLLDAGGQAVHVINQAMILQGPAESHGRLIGCYMRVYAVGSRAGTIASTASRADNSSVRERFKESIRQRRENYFFAGLAKSSSVLPAAKAVLSQPGLGPKPLQELPLSSR